MRVFLVLAIAAAGYAFGQDVSYERILNASKEPENWLTYSGTYDGQRYSTLSQITTQNVKELKLQWVFQAKSLEKYEATPLVVDGIMYTIQDPDDVVALDAVTGRVYWIYSWRPTAAARTCCGRLSRGVAILNNTLFLATIDAHVIAIDAKSGKEVWNVAVDRPQAGYAMTHAPLVIKDKVLVGVAGGEYGIRGYIDAYDAKTGARAWRFYTIPGPGEKGNETWAGDSWRTGGAPVWLTGTYDADLDLTYWGIGNPGPDRDGDDRSGDNLYSSSLVALDPNTGKLKWYYQFNPHNEFDYDATEIPVLVDIERQGRARKTLMLANRNGMFYVLDRQDGHFLMGKPFVKVTWMTGFDDNGRPNLTPGIGASIEGTLVYPGNQGATNWYSPSFSPQTGLFYIPTWDNYSSVFWKIKGKYQEGKYFGGGWGLPVENNLGSPPINLKNDEEGFGTVRAIDPKTGEKRWDFKMTDFTDAGIMTTAGNLLFSGGREGYFFALDATTGALLWRASVGGPVTSAPITYQVNGRQYVAVDAGNSLFVWGLDK
jgi:alcohol dehydrogenase (cytochrome c)